MAEWSLSHAKTLIICHPGQRNRLWYRWRGKNSSIKPIYYGMGLYQIVYMAYRLFDIATYHLPISKCYGQYTFRVENFGFLEMKWMYSHSIIQLNVAGVSMFLDVSKIALVVEIAAIQLVPYCKNCTFQLAPVRHETTDFLDLTH